MQSDVPADIFSPSRQGTANFVGDSALRRLPTLNRDFSDFVKLTPQVGVRDGDEGGISVAGQNNRFNTIQVDGETKNVVGLDGVRWALTRSRNTRCCWRPTTCARATSRAP